MTDEKNQGHEAEQGEDFNNSNRTASMRAGNKEEIVGDGYGSETVPNGCAKPAGQQLLRPSQSRSNFKSAIGGTTGLRFLLSPKLKYKKGSACHPEDHTE